MRPEEWTPALSDANYRRSRRLIIIAAVLTVINVASLVAHAVLR